MEIENILAFFIGVVATCGLIAIHFAYRENSKNNSSVVNNTGETKRTIDILEDIPEKNQNVCKATGFVFPDITEHGKNIKLCFQIAEVINNALPVKFREETAVEWLALSCSNWLYLKNSYRPGKFDDCAVQIVDNCLKLSFKADVIRITMEREKLIDEVRRFLRKKAIDDKSVESNS